MKKALSFLVLLASCSTPDKDIEINGKIEVSPNGIHVYTYLNSPCGCMAQPVRKMSCTYTTDACAGHCENCLDEIEIFVDEKRIESQKKEYYTDLWARHGYDLPAGTKIQVVIYGCQREWVFIVEVPEMKDCTYELIEDKEVTIVEWEEKDFEFMELTSVQGYAGPSCWIENDGSEETDPNIDTEIYHHISLAGMQWLRDEEQNGMKMRIYNSWWCRD